MTAYSIAVFEGDGIGPEITAPTLDLLQRASAQAGSYDLSFTTVPAGAAHYAKTGESLPEASMQTARDADAILLSAMGLPDVRYPDGTEISPQIELRKALGLFAGVRPVTVRRGAPGKREADGRIYRQGRRTLEKGGARTPEGVEAAGAGRKAPAG